jgi:hypothetical protein
MPKPNGDYVRMRAFYDDETQTHKLAVDPEGLRICKRNTRALAISANNETVNTNQYRPIVLEYRIYESVEKEPSKDPKRAFSYGPNNSNSAFLVPDDGTPCFLLLKDKLGIKSRETPCSFPEEGANEYSLIVRFAHPGWDDAFGAAEHEAWHVES